MTPESLVLHLKIPIDQATNFFNPAMVKKFEKEKWKERFNLPLLNEIHL